MKDPVKLLLGDEKSQAKTGGSATFKSGNWELSCWSTVQLTCGQTEKEVKKALEEATTLAFDHLDEIKGHLEEAMRRNLA